jgi:transcriptional regulator with XRE-family HTH domain
MDANFLPHSKVENDLGLSSSQISSWMKHDRYPRADIALKLAKYFHVSLQWLMTGDDVNAIPVEALRLLRSKQLLETMYRIERCSPSQMNAITALLDAFQIPKPPSNIYDKPVV